MRQSPRLVAAAVLAALFPLGTASAQLGFAEVGPTDPNHGFPQWYKDTNGLSLDLCTTDPALCLLLAPITLTNPALPFPDNYGGTFPDELFYQRVDGSMATNNGGQALLVMALEGAFPAGPVAAGGQTVFGRLRLRVDNLVAGANYTITTPLGIFNLVAANAGVRGINFTDDIGLVAGVFTDALASHVGPFLSWDSGLPILDAAGREYIGNPGLLHTITGSPTGTNLFRIEGPSVGGPGINSIETNLFLAMGLKSTVVVPPGAPVASFTSAPNSGNAPLTVAFTDTSTGTITSRLWSFGDGATSTLQSPTHVYGAGTFSVSLTVTGPGGSNTATQLNLISVATPPPPGNQLVLANPVPGTAGVVNTLVVTGATPGRVVGVYTGLVLGATIVNQGRCGGIPIGLGRPFRLTGRAAANAQGVATIRTTPPAGAAGRTFHFQAVEPTSCRTSNVVSELL